MNKQVILKKRPTGMPDPSTWELVSNPLPEVGDGQILIKNHYISLDPAMRGWLDDRKSYIPPVGIDEVMRAGTIGEVIAANNHPKFQVGDVLTGWGGVQEYCLSDGKNWYQVDTNLAPMTAYIGTLGMPGTYAPRMGNRLGPGRFGNRIRATKHTYRNPH